MTDILATNLRSVALRERNIGHPELADIIDSAADEIERLLGLTDWQHDEIERLRGELHSIGSA